MAQLLPPLLLDNPILISTKHKTEEFRFFDIDSRFAQCCLQTPSEEKMTMILSTAINCLSHGVVNQSKHYLSNSQQRT
jgi:hypothetical protein